MPRERIVFKFCEVCGWEDRKCEWKGVCEMGARSLCGRVAAGKGLDSVGCHTLLLAGWGGGRAR